MGKRFAVTSLLLLLSWMLNPTHGNTQNGQISSPNTVRVWVWPTDLYEVNPGEILPKSQQPPAKPKAWYRSPSKGLALRAC